VLDLFIRVTGEGRKYGLHLLLATQRPDKLHANVLSQCDNVVLLRVNSAADRAQLQEQFSFAPAGLVELAGRFRQGEALLAGPITPFPLLARFGRRLTPEGGSDVPTDWAR
jgi:DNA helicase HerA-like ATPase